MKLGNALRDPWVWGQAGLTLLVGLLPLIAGSFPPESFPARLLATAQLSWRAPALLPFLLGAPLLVWGAISMGKSLTPATRPLRRGELVEHGPYKLVRHPIYVGVSLCLWALAWFLTNPVAGIMIAVLCFFYFDRKAAVEERWMLDRFPEYEQYRQRVPKLIPWTR